MVGLAIAAELSTTHSPTVLLERHSACGREASSRNSEVIHAGIYYPHGSLKASLCVEGRQLLYSLCEQHRIPYRRIGKVITATEEDEVGTLEQLYDHGKANGVDLTLLTAEVVARLEPSIRTVGGILSESTGIISAHGLMDCFRHRALAQDAVIQTGCAVTGIDRYDGSYRLTVDDHGNRTSLDSEIVINAAGLDADIIAGMAGIDTVKAGYTLSWVKGSYFGVRGTKRGIISRLVYPIPSRDSLGVHAVVDLGGGLRFGPDVEYLAGREQDYKVDAGRLNEFGNAVRRIVPSIKDEDLFPDQSGIRAKLQKPDENAKDFVIRHEVDKGLNGFINLIGIDSPGLTSSPAIARKVRSMVDAL